MPIPLPLPRIRAAAVVCFQDALLVMFRRRGGREYYTFPGGGVEPGETLAAAAAREVEEETSLVVLVDRLLYELVRTGEGGAVGGTREYFFLCSCTGGTPALGAESIEREIGDVYANYFEPCWLPCSSLTDTEVPLMPPEIARELRRDLTDGFAPEPRVVSGAPIA